MSSERDNGPAVTALAFDPSALGPLSPELVLVSPPEMASRARLVLPAYPPIAPRPVPAAATPKLGLGFFVFCVVCAASTVVPLLLAALAMRHP